MTKILIISDIHSNLTALEAVLAEACNFDETWCLGDIVGYGPDPNECVARIQGLPKLTCLMGNHDLACSGSLPLDAFNNDARSSLLWQKEILNQESLVFLNSLPPEAVTLSEATLAHGSPRDSIWEYILNTLVARLNMASIQTPWCFVGHSHFQVVFQYYADQDSYDIITPEAGARYDLKDRAVLNPGSVGQPRDRNPKAAYAFFYPEAHIWEPHRVSYDIPAVQKRILAVGLPARHAERLSDGT